MMEDVQRDPKHKYILLRPLASIGLEGCKLCFGFALKMPHYCCMTASDGDIMVMQ